MKKLSTLLFFLVFRLAAQPLVSDFENLTLANNSFYTDTNSVPFTSHNSSFMYQWTKGAFPYWSGGFSYTNIHDSTTKTYVNLYGVKALKGYNNSQKFVAAKDQGVIKMTVPQTTVTGFYVTNTTYAYHSMKDGDSFTRKFGDTLGAGSGTTMAQGSRPDFFKLTVRGFDNGVIKQDSVEFYLADYRSANNTADYILKDWQWVNTTALGEVDSIQFFMYTSVNNTFGALTPLFFGMDDFTTVSAGPSVIMQYDLNSQPVFFPNPFNDKLYLGDADIRAIKVIDLLGKVVYQSHETNGPLELGFLVPGQYVVECLVGETIVRKKMTKS
jgi:hypothetical protein